jgi:uncharacterized protein YdhG (YjbR/CyaY superfamily)
MKVDDSKKVDDYILSFNEDIQSILNKTRETIKKFSPKDSIECICYLMPTLYYKENIIHYAGFKKHLGLYPGRLVIQVFSERLKEYKTGPGTIQMPYNKPIDYKLIEDIVKFRCDGVLKKENETPIRG